VSAEGRVGGIRFTWLNKSGGIAGVHYVFDFGLSLSKLVDCTALVGPDGVLLQTGMMPYMRLADEVCVVLSEAHKAEWANVDLDYARRRGLTR
jgi:hypothetical protein